MRAATLTATFPCASETRPEYIHDWYLTHFRYGYSSEGNKLLVSVRPHQKSVRAVDFSMDGTCTFPLDINEIALVLSYNGLFNLSLALVTVSRDKSIAYLDLVSGKSQWRQEKAHPHPINTLLIEENNLMFTGDDEGVVKVCFYRRPFFFSILTVSGLGHSNAETNHDI